MRADLRLLFGISLSVLALNTFAQTQTPATGSVLLSGSVQGPAYPCGNTSCPTYDSGQITISVGAFNATTSYARVGGQMQAEQLANILTAQLNSGTSPVTAVRSNTKITLTSKQTGTSSNYALSAAATHNNLFPATSFSVTASGPALIGGTAGGGHGGGVTPPSITPIGTVTAQLSNNTSLCSSSKDPGGNRPYCSAFFNGFKTGSINQGAQTLVPDSPAGHVSDVSIKQLMYPGWNGRVLCHYLPWFGNSNHKSVGYNENASATVYRHHTDRSGAT